eukprot:TRINITY_DN11273_c0_g2_i1.p1 TRINITY_DN11273_c0_g2~~TRINITY_DN11273_c0_g2_i1.p1  ORF type:complete len:312 (-),score=79.38 TRINITY_DN11273_c0_g2_i1:58-969(-)
MVLPDIETSKNADDEREQQPLIFEDVDRSLHHLPKDLAASSSLRELRIPHKVTLTLLALATVCAVVLAGRTNGPPADIHNGDKELQPSQQWSLHSMTDRFKSVVKPLAHGMKSGLTAMADFNKSALEDAMVDTMAGEADAVSNMTNTSTAQKMEEKANKLAGGHMMQSAMAFYKSAMKVICVAKPKSFEEKTVPVIVNVLTKQEACVEDDRSAACAELLADALTHSVLAAAPTDAFAGAAQLGNTLLGGHIKSQVIYPFVRRWQQDLKEDPQGNTIDDMFHQKAVKMVYDLFLPCRAKTEPVS